MIIIIGAGLAGYQVAREFRKLNTSAALMIVTADDGRFYSKPLLSSALTQKKTAAMIATADAEAMALQLNAEIRTHSQVTAIDTVAQTLTTKGECVPYEKLIFACGADVIKAPLTGDGVSDVLSINHLYHYTEFEKLVQNKKRIAVLGAGLIGCEFANDLSNANYSVHMIAPDQTPLERFIPPQIGRLLQSALEKNGVQFHLNCLPQAVMKVSERYEVHLSNQEKVEVDLVLSAIGLRPHIELAERAEIKTARGILVNRYLETSAENCYALGDCAEVEGHVLPFITPMLNCARALAKTLAGVRTAVEYPAMPVIVKTPAHPIVLCLPPQGILGEWEIAIEKENVRALFFDAKRQLYGFVLTNAAVAERAELVRQIPGLF